MKRLSKHWLISIYYHTYTYIYIYMLLYDNIHENTGRKYVCVCVCVYYVRQYIKRPWTKRVVRLYHSFSLFENYPLPPPRSLGLFHREILVAVPWVGSLSFRHALLYFLIILALPVAFSTRTLFFYHNLC